MTTAEAVEAYWEAAKGLLSEAEEELSKGVREDMGFCCPGREGSSSGEGGAEVS